MPHTELLVWILIVNALVAFAVLIVDLMLKKRAFAAVHFFVILFCPVTGAVFFLGEKLFGLIFRKKRVLDYGDIGFDTTRREKKVKGNLLEEVNLLSLDEAFAVSDKSNRRRVLLTALKRDYKKNIASVRRGLNNDDTETSHYAASAVLSLMTEYLNRLDKLTRAYERGENMPGTAREYADTLTQFLGEGIMDDVSERKYAGIFIGVAEFLYLNHPEELTAGDFVYVMKLLTETGVRGSIETWIERAVKEYPEDDSVYYTIMRAYYKDGDSGKFLGAMQNLMRSSMNISNETLQVIRFFNYRPV